MTRALAFSAEALLAYTREWMEIVVIIIIIIIIIIYLKTRWKYWRRPRLRGKELVSKQKIRTQYFTLVGVRVGVGDKVGCGVGAKAGCGIRAKVGAKVECRMGANVGCGFGIGILHCSDSLSCRYCLRWAVNIDFFSSVSLMLSLDILTYCFLI